MNTYIIFGSDYMGIEPGIEEFVGTFRDLLYKLNNVTPDNIDNEFLVEGVTKTAKTQSCQELKECFDIANGDGQPYYLVWCVESHSQVIK